MPWTADGSIFRTALVNRLRAALPARVVTVIAPPGYGKSTLLAQWAARDERPFASFPGPLRGASSVLVVDDVHLLEAAGLANVSRLIADAPAGATVAIAGRSLPDLPGLSVARLRAAGSLLELGHRDLAFTRRETTAFLKASGVPAGERDLGRFLERTEGWPAGIAQAVAARASVRGGTLDGNGITRAFFREECLDGLTAAQREFIRRTSVLDRMSGPLCDAVLGRTGSARDLEALHRLGLFLVPLDREGLWYRYHHLLRNEVRSELTAVEPELEPELHRRAADWHEEHGNTARAIAHARLAGDEQAALRVFGAGGLRAHDAGRGPEVEDWLACMDDARSLARTPNAAVLAARLHAHHGRLDDAERCLAAAEKGSGGARGTRVRARAALVRAALAEGGAEAMLENAGLGLAALTREDPWHAYGLLLRGTAKALLGRNGSAEAVLARAAHAAQRLNATETQILALAQRALLANERGAHATADTYNGAALETAEAARLDGYGTVALPLVLAAQSGLRAGRWADARASIARAQAMLPSLTAALPWLAVQTRLELARAHLMLRDGESARALLREVDRLLAVRPGLGRLAAERRRLGREVRLIPSAGDGHGGRLTGAELRLLPLLGTHLSFREIGAQLFLSRHTVKTQAISAYRKLGASSRREAVVRAGELGLIEPSR